MTLLSTPLLAVCSRGLHHLANSGSRYVSSNNICKAFGRKRGHLLGNATSLSLHGIVCSQADRGSAIGQMRVGIGGMPEVKLS